MKLESDPDTPTTSFYYDLSSLRSSLQGEILWTVLGPKKILRLTAISSFSKQVAAFYEKRGFLSAASQSKEPSFLGFESTNETRSLTIANEESEARRSTSKTIHPQLLRKNYELDQGKLNQSYVKEPSGLVIDSADDNLHPMMGMLQADTDTFTGIAPADRGRIERDSTKIKIDQIDIVEEDLGLNFKRCSYSSNLILQDMIIYKLIYYFLINFM